VIAGRLALRTLEGAVRADRSPRARRTESEASAGGHTLAWLSSPGIWIAAGIVLTILLRMPWIDAPLGRDEGGVAWVAQHWHGGGPFPYGDWFLDRPPLLVALYRVTGDSAIGIRLLGAVAASMLVWLSVLLAVRLDGRRAAPWAAAISAVLASCYALRSVFTPAELLAAVPSCASVLVLVLALERRRLWLFASAGALAVVALLVKQSFGDALVAGAVALLAAPLAGVPWRESLRRAAAFLGGVAVMVIALLIWAGIEGTSLSSVWYAMFGFRLDAVSAVSGAGFEGRLSNLGSLFLTSGLALSGVVAAVGIARLRSVAPTVRLVLAAWLLAAVIGILLGGSYWPHYLIALVPGFAACAGALLGRHRVLAALTVAVIAVPIFLNAATAGRSDSADNSQLTAVALGHYVRDRALPHQTAYVLYAKVNVLYYARIPAPFPYNWSLMMRAAPHAEARLRALLASPERPTWVVKADSTHSFGLDRSGATNALLLKHYRRVTKVCGFPVLLERGAGAGPAPGPALCPKKPSSTAPPA
jgi:hypothetical protein